MKNYIRNQRRENKSTLVFVHGNSSSSNVFNPIFESELFDENLISFDFFGHGKSPWLSIEHKYSIESYRKQLLEITSNVMNDVYIIAHSLGGHIAIEVATSIENLKGLLVFGTPPIRKPINFNEAFNPVEILNMMYTDKVDDENLEILFQKFTRNKSYNEILKKDFRNTDPRIRLNLAAELQNPDTLLDEVNIFKNLNCKKLIINGENDPAINKEYIRLIQKECNFDFLEVKDSGHYISVEKRFEFNRLVKEFVN
ncbi:MAG: hypothetical protein CVV25_02635 [Ignavibacteriae bacterium HGW-Ignavibacteriae-4]|jgi:pimeloyl-ACP methyl ester carboxylesterase|nr:MAG: hypothetical protein CVV25_02635 [Ignavibacteriae bacterium HGW-Ignavibacteriae-4]